MRTKQQIKEFRAIQKSIGKRIRWARELVEPSAMDFARVLGLHRTTIAKIEDGTRAPSLVVVLDISRRLRVTPDYILTGAMFGVDVELARRLIRRHPELGQPPAPNTYGNRLIQYGGNNVQPMIPKRA